MISQQLLSILRCPRTHSPLTRAEPPLLARLNEAQARGELVNGLGQPVERPLTEGLVNADRSLLYPIIDDVPQMIADEAIPLESIGGTADLQTSEDSR